MSSNIDYCNDPIIKSVRDSQQQAEPSCASDCRLDAYLPEFSRVFWCAGAARQRPSDSGDDD